MADRAPVVAANWKMHKTRAQTEAFLDAVLPRAAELHPVKLVVCPAFTSLQTAVERCAGTPVGVSAQNMHFEHEGPFTGEVSAPMLSDLGVDAVLIGHSERRQLFGESDEALARKVPAAITAGLTPILCIGETGEQRDSGETEAVLRSQIEGDLAQVVSADIATVVIAYEPVWAIGTGRNATPEQAAEAIDFIRTLIGARAGGAGEGARILYGGSVTPGNASELLGQEGIDGALVGGASLDPGDFAAIAAAAKQ